MSAYITFLLILIAFAILIYSMNKQGQKLTSIFSSIQSSPKSDQKDKSIKPTKYFKNIKDFLIYINIFLFLILFVTGFIPTLFNDNFLTGLPLIIHVTAAPAFAISLSIFILFFSFRFKLNRTDFNDLIADKKIKDIKPKTITKISFWLITFFSIPLLVSIILILYPILGTESQEFFILIHRLSATIITITCILMLYAGILQKKVV